MSLSKASSPFSDSKTSSRSNHSYLPATIQGKGLILTQNVCRGTLLLAAKAYAVSANSSAIRAVNMINDNIVSGSQVQLVTNIIHTLKRNPQTSKDLYALYSGDENRDKQIPEGIIDASLIERICRFNSFGISAEMTAEGEGKSKGCKGTGLWMMPSFANHCCLGNAHRVFIGDMQFFYAMRDLRKGDELTITYAPPLNFYEERRLILAPYGFECMCKLCELDREDLQADKRRVLLLEQMKTQAAQLGFTVGAALKLVQQFRQSYGSRTEWHSAMYSPLTMLASFYDGFGNRAKEMEICEEILLVLGNECLESHLLINTYTRMVQCCVRMRPPAVRRAKQIAQKAFDWVRDVKGIKDKTLFLELYPQFRAYLQ